MRFGYIRLYLCLEVLIECICLSWKFYCRLGCRKGVIMVLEVLLMWIGMLSLVCCWIVFRVVVIFVIGLYILV